MTRDDDAGEWPVNRAAYERSLREAPEMDSAATAAWLAELAADRRAEMGHDWDTDPIPEADALRCDQCGTLEPMSLAGTTARPYWECGCGATRVS